MAETVESAEDISNDEWVKENFEDLIQAYPRKWIAVRRGQVVVSGGTRFLVERKAKAAHGKGGYSIYFIPPTNTRTDVTYESH